MATASAATKKQPSPALGVVYRPILGEYFSLETLWDTEAPAPLFNSEGAARWFLRKNRVSLVEAKATAIHAGKLLVHPERFAAVAVTVALHNAASRAGCIPS